MDVSTWSRRVPVPTAGDVEVVNAAQLDLVARSERRSELTWIGGLRGVHEVRSRYHAVHGLKVLMRGEDIPTDVLDTILPA